MFFDAKACGASTEETEGGETRRDFGGWLRKLQSRVHVSRLLSQTQSRKEGAKNAKVCGRLFLTQRHRVTERGVEFSRRAAEDAERFLDWYSRKPTSKHLCASVSLC